MSFFKEKSDYILTFITEFVILIAGVLVYKFAANLEGANDFSEYAISRRTISFILPLLIMGLGVGIPRYIAFSNDNKKKQGTYFFSGIILTMSFALPFLLIINLFKNYFSFLFFGDQSFYYLIPSLSMMTLGMLFHALSYGYFRGKIMMHHANILQFLNLGVTPIIVFLFFNTVNEIILYTGIIWLIISIIANLFILLNNEVDYTTMKSASKELFIYGIWRVPGDFVLAGFLALPAYFTAHMVSDDLKSAGYVAFSMSLLNMAGAAFGPICLILLPKASIIIKNKDFKLLKDYFHKITYWTLGLTIIGILFIEIFAEEIIFMYLGDNFDDLVYCVRITVFASIGFTLYISLRSILDAYYVKAVNTKNIIISFCIFIVMETICYFFISTDYLSILYCFDISMIILGLLTFYETRKIIIKSRLE